MRSLLAGLLLGLLPAGAGAAAPADAPVFAHPATAAQLEQDLAGVAATLRAARVLRGRYVQERRLRELPKPLVAAGTYRFVRDLGIAWRTETPFPSELVITRGEIVSRELSPSGEPGAERRVGVEQQPAIRHVATLFFAIFALDFAALERDFELFSRRAGDGWELGLLPRAAGPVERIVVSGRSHVEQVSLRESGGDRSDIRLLDSRAAAAVAPEDRAAFPPG